MGKTKRKKGKNKMLAPTGLQSLSEIKKNEDAYGLVSTETVDVAVKGGVFSALDDSVRVALQNVIEKLQSSGVEDKNCACCTLASLASTQNVNLQQLLKSDVVRVAGPLLVDRSAIVSHSAITALRTISNCDDHIVCEMMIEQDIMTPLAALFKQFSSEWKPLKLVEGKTDSKKETFIEAVQLLWNLCENSSKAIRIFNKEPFLNVLMPCLNVEIYGQEVAVNVAYCLHTVSEDNVQVAAILNETKNSEMINCLLSLPPSNAGNTLLRVLAAGIFLNMNIGRLSGCPPTIVSSLLKVLSDAIAVDVIPLLTSLCDKFHNDKEPTATTNVQSIEWLVAAQEVALEVLINICCNDDEGESWEDVGSSDTSDEIDSFDVEMDCDNDGGAEKFPLSVPAEVQEVLVSHEFLKKVLSKLQIMDSDLRRTLSKSPLGKQLYKSMVSIQSRSLLCINNLTSCLDIEELGGPSQLYDLWLDLGKLAFREIEESRFDLLEGASGAMRAVLQKLAEVKSTQFERFSITDLQKLCEFGQSATDACVRANVVRMVGSLGCLLGSFANETNDTMIALVGSFLLEVAFKDTELWVEAEALDSVFDVFADDNMNSIAVQIGLVEKLKQFVPVFKKKVGLNRKDVGEHAPIIMTAKMNLGRFIHYKTSTVT